jgi:uncharacterized protein YjdB
MFSLKRACIALAGIVLAACGDDRSVNPTSEFVDGNGAAITTGGTLVAQYSLAVGQTLKINPKTTTRTNRLKWSSSNSTVASVNSTGTVTARTSGNATVQVSGNGVLENYAVTVTAPVAPKVTSFSLQPKTGISLTSGQSRQFAASATWSDGMQYPITVSYTATGGTISGTGLFTAGNLAGTFMVVATCACASPAIADTAFVNITAPQLTKLTVSPKTVSLAAGASQQFAVTASWNTGATTVPPVTWSASGGTVSSTGAYVAPSAAGTYRVIVAHSGGSVRDTAVVTVNATTTTATLTSLTLSPSAVSMQPGATQQFRPTSTWSDNSTAEPNLSYSSTGGSVSPSGLFTAPSVPGTYRLIVAHTNGTRRDTSLVTVTSTTASATSFTTNLPTGLFQITDSQFGNLLANTNYNEDSLAHAWDGRNAVDITAPFGTGVYEMFYPGNHAGNGDGGGILWGRGGNQWRRVYFSLMVWLPANYSIHTNTEKFFYPIIYTPGEPDQSTSIGWKLIGNDTANGETFGFGFNSQVGGAGSLAEQPATSAVRVRKGRWARIEMYCEMNTPGQQNGVWRTWVDGQLAVNFTNVRYSASAGQSYFNGIRFTGTRGGGASAVLTPPEGQVRRYDRLAFFASGN